MKMTTTNKAGGTAPVEGKDELVDLRLESFSYLQGAHQIFLT